MHAAQAATGEHQYDGCTAERTGPGRWRCPRAPAAQSTRCRVLQRPAACRAARPSACQAWQAGAREAGRPSLQPSPRRLARSCRALRTRTAPCTTQVPARAMAAVLCVPSWVKMRHTVQQDQRAPALRAGTASPTCACGWHQRQAVGHADRACKDACPQPWPCCNHPAPDKTMGQQGPQSAGQPCRQCQPGTPLPWLTGL